MILSIFSHAIQLYALDIMEIEIKVRSLGSPFLGEVGLVYNMPKADLHTDTEITAGKPNTQQTGSFGQFLRVGSKCGLGVK